LPTSDGLFNINLMLYFLTKERGAVESKF